MSITEVPVLAGVHHLKLPVSDLTRSAEWYQSRLGYRVAAEFAEQGTLMGYAMVHPAGGPDLALRLDPDRARAAAGFDYFSIGVPDREALDALAARTSGCVSTRRALRRQRASTTSLSASLPRKRFRI